MKITVKLYGSFRFDHPHYDEQKGLVLEMPDGTQVKDILPRLGISADQGAISSIESKLVPLSHSLNHGVEVKIMQLAMGG